MRHLIETIPPQRHLLLAVTKIKFGEVVGDHQAHQLLELANVNHGMVLYLAGPLATAGSITDAAGSFG